MGQADTFEAAFPDLFRVAYRAAFRVTGDAEASEDAASEALTRAALRWRRVSDRALPWVVRVATNLAIDHVRAEARRSVARPATGDRAAPDAAARIDLHRALAALPTRQREVVVLRYFGDLSEREIAAELGLAPGTVKSHASRGLATLRTALATGDRAPFTPGPEPMALQPEELR